MRQIKLLSDFAGQLIKTKYPTVSKVNMNIEKLNTQLLDEHTTQIIEKNNQKYKKKFSNTPIPKVASGTITKLNNSKIISSVKNTFKLNKASKIGIGVLGAASLIGGGIALNRKSRNDKGKKRGFYRK